MKIGTLWCWLFGHKFLAYTRIIVHDIEVDRAYRQTKFCVRCGIDK